MVSRSDGTTREQSLREDFTGKDGTYLTVFPTCHSSKEVEGTKGEGHELYRGVKGCKRTQSCASDVSCSADSCFPSK